MATKNTEVYEIITGKIVAALENGVAPWRKPWVSVANGPKNAVTGKLYRGINVLMLMLDGYTDSRWLTFKQAKDLGGSVTKGQKGTPVVFWNWVEREEERDGVTVTKRVPFLRYYTVFNVEQCEGLKLKPEEIPEPLNDGQRIEVAEAIVNGYRNAPKIKNTDHAVYYPLTDQIGIPPVKRFVSKDAYYATLFHELTHSTGHSSRLNRLEPATFGSDKYAKEELVAEIGAAFLCNLCGIDSTLDQNAAYLSGWLKVLKADSKLILTAAGAAQRAVDYIIGDDEETEEEA